MEYDKSIFRNNICFLRHKSGLSQAKFGEKIGISQHLVSVYENGYDPNPTVNTLISLSKYANTSIEALLTLNLEDNVFNFGTRRSNASKFEYSHFEGMTYNMYFLQERKPSQFYHGFLSLDKNFDEEHSFLHGTVTTAHIYDCKMVIEENNTVYLYGTEINMPRRFHIGLYYPDFREEVKYRAGLGILTRIDRRKYFVGMKVAISVNELDTNDVKISEGLIQFLTEGERNGQLSINRDKDDEFREWVQGLY